MPKKNKVIISRDEYLKMKELVKVYEDNKTTQEDLDKQPYYIIVTVGETQAYNPNYGDNRTCKCGHPYYRHFDTYEDMYPCGCKYCQCFNFVEKKLKSGNNTAEKITLGTNE